MKNDNIRCFVSFNFNFNFSYAETTIRIASVSGPSHHHNVAGNWFADKVNKQKIGVTFKVMAGGQLGK